MFSSVNYAERLPTNYKNFNNNLIGNCLSIGRYNLYLYVSTYVNLIYKISLVEKPAPQNPIDSASFKSSRYTQNVIIVETKQRHFQLYEIIDYKYVIKLTSWDKPVHGRHVIIWCRRRTDMKSARDRFDWHQSQEVPIFDAIQ